MTKYDLEYDVLVLGMRYTLPTYDSQSAYPEQQKKERKK